MARERCKSRERGSQGGLLRTVLQTARMKNMTTQAKAWAMFPRPFLLRRPDYGGQVGPLSPNAGTRAPRCHPDNAGNAGSADNAADNADTPTRRHADTPTRRHADTPTRRHADTPPLP
jgi:hypothetical protein